MYSSYEEIYKKAAGIKHCEPVSGDFEIKKTGMDILSRFIDLKGSGMALEVGSGSGFNAALLSSFSRRLVATDLPYYDVNTHSLGILVAKDLLSGLAIDNTSILSCSGEALPFPDNTFDFVYSSSVLEHITDKEKALKEMLRVCKSGGSVIFIIPTFVQSLCAFLHLYLYIAKRALDVFCVKVLRIGPKAKGTLLPKADDTLRSGSKIVGSFWKNHPSFPLPEPHGAYKNIFHEFVNQLPGRWTALAKKCGAASVDSFAFLFIPFNVLEVFTTKAIAKLYSSSRGFHYAAGKSFLKHFAYSLCVVAKKG
ncbi:MAG: class I SAM-dependent methyltransferase [Candidatus Omnitrophota bacterium]|jgi:ubiquinone/menaquinone biosynthesis C-methylase UbiE